MTDFTTLVQMVASGLMTGVLYALVATGLSLIWGLMGLINFAHGEYLMLGMYTAFWAWFLWGIDPLWLLPVTIVLFFGLGVLMYKVMVKRLLNAPILAQVCATFGLGILLRGVAQFFWTPNYRRIVGVAAAGRVEAFGIYLGLPQLVAAGGAALIIAMLYWWIRRTDDGRALQATAEDKEAAALVGINTERMFVVGWGVGLACAGVAGTLLAMFYYVYPDVGVTFILLAFVAVALGGLGSVEGALIGALIVGLVEVLGGFLISPAFKLAMVFTLYICVLALRPQGLFGRW